MLSFWIDQITIDTLLNLCPHGFLAGCGETSEYLAYAFRIQPKDYNELFQRFNRQGEYYNSAVNELSFNSMNKAIEEINIRLRENGYVRVSLTTMSIDNDKIDILDYLRSKPKAKLFDHSFIIVNYHGIKRIESYINEYKPRIVSWESYQSDLINLMNDPLNEWKRIFEVECEPNYDLDNIEIIISN